jgi:uncharacterized repeat protein (TIGR01451 family)
MNRNQAPRRRRAGSPLSPHQKAILHRPVFERLETRLMLDAGGLPASIVLGRTLATPSTAATAAPSPSYFMGEIQNNQVTITYTVYNQAADTETGVLLIDTLAPGVSVVSSTVTLDGTTTTQPPGQSGQNLAWSLAPIEGYDRESVALTINLPELGASQTTPFAIDAGADADAMLDAGAVSTSTPAATIGPGNVSDPSLLASTVDADTTDPYIQEVAAALNYDPTQIFNFLHTQIGYNSYLGSVRGARGTLWSDAGNALDVASLGVALMHASGIPAQYVSGTLSQSQAQQLILSMFPTPYQTVGYIPQGTQVSDPADDPQLLAETESHDWFQFESRGTMVNADPLMPGAATGQTFTTSAGTFSAVPQSLEETTEVQLVAEIYSSAAAAFGVGGGLQDTTVLDQTFDDDYLVGRPLSFGNLVTSQSSGFIISATTNTYTPYVNVGDFTDPNPNQDETITGTAYQEVLTNFPLGSQILTGLFLNITLSGPNGTPEAYQRSLLDRIGPAVRQNGETPDISVSPNGQPAFTDQDIFTLYATASLNAPSFPGQYPALLGQLSQQLSQAQAQAATSTATPQESTLLTDNIVALTGALGSALLTDSDATTSRLASDSLFTAYFVRPRLILVSSRVVIDQTSNTAKLAFSIDLRRDTMRILSSPGQATSNAIAFDALRGVAESLVEQQVPAALLPASQPQLQSVSAVDVFRAALAQGIGLVLVTTANLSILGSMDISPDAKALITTAVDAGDAVIVPAQSVSLDGSSTTAWYQVNPATGETIGVTQDGEHGILGLTGTYLFLSAAIAGGLAGLVVSGVILYVVIPAINAITAAISGHSLAPYLADIQGSLSTGTPAAVAGLPELGDSFTSLLEKVINVPLPGAPDVTPLSDPEPSEPIGFNQPDANITDPVDRSAGSVSGNVQTTAIAASGQLSASWSGSDSASFLVNTLSAGQATVKGQNGQTIGAGPVQLSATGVPVALSGNASYTISGQGSLSAYGSAPFSLAVSADWASYSATVSGQVSVAVATGSLSLGGATLPAGTCTITTSALTFAGSSLDPSPNFAKSAKIDVADGTVYLVGGTGQIAVGGSALSPSGGATFTGYTGSLAVGQSGSAVSVALSGSAANVLAVADSPAALTTDENHSVSFQFNVLTSSADTYHTDVIAPNGWSASIGQNGRVTVVPPPGVQAGTYPIELKALLLSQPDLVAQSVVEVTIKPTQAGMNLSVEADAQFTVPLNAAQLPTAFRGSIQNLGPAADTYDLTFSNVPSGFSIESSGTTDTVPAGATGMLGVYLVPNPGQPIPAPGTQLSFTVTATSPTNSSITQTVTQTFTVPNIDAVTVTASPTAAGTIPGGPVTETLTLTNAGNVAENNVTLTDALSSGLTLTGLAPVSLGVGRSTTESITLTPSSSTPLNSMLNASITVTFGPSASPLTQSVQIPLTIAAPGATAIANAATAANQLGDTDLATQLSNLSTAITRLIENPTSQVDMSQSVASLDAFVKLLSTDPYLGSFAGALSADGIALSQSTTATAIQSALAKLGTDLTTVSSALAGEAAHGFTLSLTTNSEVAQPQVPTPFELSLQNTGSQTTTYDLATSGLPSGVTASFSQPSITLGPGQATGSGGVPDLTVTLTPTSTSEAAPFSFTVSATAEGAGEITRSDTGSLAARTQIVQVVSVTPNPTFTEPGGTVEVSATILNAVNQEQEAQVSYVVEDPSGNEIFRSQPVTTTLKVLATLSTVYLGNLSTSGFALGQDTIVVTVATASGDPIPGATGQGTLLIGTPVTATLSLDKDQLPAGSGTVTDTLQVTGQSAAFSPFSLEGQLAISGATGVAVDGSLAYVGTSGGIDVVDISNPSSPKVLSTFGTSDFPSGLAVQMQVYNRELVVLATQFYGPSYLLVYSLATPSSPTLLGQTPLTLSTGNDMDLTLSSISNDQVYTAAFAYRYFIFSGEIFAQFGESIDIDISDPTHPTVQSVIYNDAPDPTLVYPDGNSKYPDGTSNVWQSAAANAQMLLVGTTSANQGTVNGTGVQGLVMVVDTSDPSNPSVLEKLAIPGMAVVTGISVQGNQAFVLGSTQNWAPGIAGFGGKVEVATLDLTNPQSPTVTSTQTLDIPSTGISYLESLGGGKYVTSYNAGSHNQTSQPELLVLDDSNPQNVSATAINVPNVVNWDVASGNMLLTADGTNLLIYNIGASGTVPATAQVTVPANGAAVVPGSFSVAPTNSTTNADGSETLTWDLTLSGSNPSRAITWQTSVTGLEPNEMRKVAQDATVAFTSQGTPGTLSLPDLAVTGEGIIGLSPPTQTVAPGAPASYEVELSNPTGSDVTYSLSITGVAASWVSLPRSVTVAANGSEDLPLVITSDSFAPEADYGFAITANGDNSARDSVQGQMVLQGRPVVADAQSRGVVVSLSRSQATAGQGTSANYIIQLTNTGSADDSFSLAAAGLPSGVTASFAQNTIDVPPGTSNSRDLALALAVASGTAPANYAFTVTATSTSEMGVTSTASGTLTVTAAGVKVTLNPPSGVPGSKFQAMVTNTGTVSDTYKLTLAGPGLLVSTLGMKQLTLAPGASLIIPITTAAVNFAVQGSLPLVATATSVSNQNIQGSATADLNIAATQAMTAEFNAASQTLSHPGTATFVLMVHNTGNTQDSYSATIAGNNGQVQASLIGLDGSPTQTIPTFILPGLATGEIELRVDLAAVGERTVTVRIQSLTNSSIMASPVATATLQPQGGPKVTELQRDGYHMMPTTLVLTFDQALDAATADDPKNYQIIAPGGRTIRIKKAVYNSEKDTVTLSPAERISIHHRYTLVVDGKKAGGISNRLGEVLDSQGSSKGSNERIPITWRNLVLDPPNPDYSKFANKRDLG